MLTVLCERISLGKEGGRFFIGGTVHLSGETRFASIDQPEQRQLRNGSKSLLDSVEHRPRECVFPDARVDRARGQGFDERLESGTVRRLCPGELPALEDGKRRSHLPLLLERERS